MKKTMQLFIVAFVALTSAFFVYDKEAVVEAACPMGQYFDAAEKKGCRPISDKMTVTNEKENVSNIEKGFTMFAGAMIYLASGISLLVIILSGFQYTLSEGDPYKIEEAKNNLIRAGIGLLIAFSIFQIMNLVKTLQGF